MTLVPRILVVVAVIDEHRHTDADLGGGQTDPLGEIHRGEHVIDQPRQFRVELGDPCGRFVQNGITNDDHGAGLTSHSGAF